jgi:hypothetical protein
MPRLTRPNSKSIKEDLKSSQEFRRSFLCEAAKRFVSGEANVGMVALRHYIRATIGFTALGVALNRSPRSLRRMIHPSANPKADKLFEVTAYLQKLEVGHFKFQFVPEPESIAA